MKVVDQIYLVPVLEVHDNNGTAESLTVKYKGAGSNCGALKATRNCHACRIDVVEQRGHSSLSGYPGGRSRCRPFEGRGGTKRGFGFPKVALLSYRAMSNCFYTIELEKSGPRGPRWSKEVKIQRTDLYCDNCVRV
jgi:hypothetical protein